MNIRRATPEDAAALARVHIDSWRAAYRGLVPDSHLAALDVELWAQRFRETLAADAPDSEATYVAEQDGRGLGFVTIGASRDADLDPRTTGEIWGSYLAPGTWRQGIGTRLCRHGERLLRDSGCQAATLWVFASNDQARRFYESMGFAPDGAASTLDGAPRSKRSGTRRC